MVNAKNARNFQKGWRTTACRFPRLGRPSGGAGNVVAVARWWVLGDGHGERTDSPNMTITENYLNVKYNWSDPGYYPVYACI